MVVIRLARAGKRKNPFYHVCVTDRRNPRDGRFIERVGFYNPIARGESTSVSVDLDRVDYWMSVGAIPSPKVKSIIKRVRNSQVAEPEAEDVAAEESAEESSDSDEVVADAETEASTEESAGEPTEDSDKQELESEDEEKSTESNSEEGSK